MQSGSLIFTALLQHFGSVFQKPVDAICRWMDFDKLLKIMNGKMALHEKCHVTGNKSSARSCCADSLKCPVIRVNHNLGEPGITGGDRPECSRSCRSGNRK